MEEKPNILDAHIVGALYHNSDLRKRAYHLLDEGLFPDSAHKIIIRALKDSEDNGYVPTEEILLHYLAGSLPPDMARSAVDGLSEPRGSETFLLQELAVRAQQRALREAVFAAYQVWKDESPSKGKLKALIQTFEEAIALGSLHEITSSNVKDLSTLLSRTQASIVSSYGIKELDALTGGGLHRKRLSVVAGTSGLGKSLFLCHLAVLAARKGRNVYYGSWELSETDVQWRLIQRLFQTPQVNIAMGKQLNLIAKRIKSLPGNIYIGEYSRSQGMSHVRAEIEALKKKDDLEIDMLITDYGQIMGSSSNTGSMYFDSATPYEEMRSYALQENISVVTAAQLNRGAYLLQNSDKEFYMPNTSNLGESMKILHITDVFIALGATGQMKQAGRVDAKVLKNRLGATPDDSIELEIDYTTGYIKGKNDVICPVCNEVCNKNNCYGNI